jgi:laccase
MLIFMLMQVLQVPFPEIPTTAHMDYEGSSHKETIHMPTFPAHNDTGFRSHFDSLQKGKNTTYQTLDVPQNVDKHIFFTVGYGLDSASSCRPLKKCTAGYDGQYRIIGAVNNISFVVPNDTRRSLLEYAYLRDHGESVSTSALDLAFPSQPQKTFNYTGAALPLSQWFSKKQTKLSVINFNASVQVGQF